MPELEDLDLQHPAIYQRGFDWGKVVSGGTDMFEDGYRLHSYLGAHPGVIYEEEKTPRPRNRLANCQKLPWTSHLTSS